MSTRIHPCLPLVACLLLTACERPDEGTVIHGADTDHVTDEEIQWFEGNVDQAFNAARDGKDRRFVTIIRTLCEPGTPEKDNCQSLVTDVAG